MHVYEYVIVLAQVYQQPGYPMQPAHFRGVSVVEKYLAEFSYFLTINGCVICTRTKEVCVHYAQGHSHSM